MGRNRRSILESRGSARNPGVWLPGALLGARRGGVAFIHDALGRAWSLNRRPSPRTSLAPRFVRRPHGVRDLFRRNPRDASRARGDPPRARARRLRHPRRRLGSGVHLRGDPRHGGPALRLRLRQGHRAQAERGPLRVLRASPRTLPRVSSPSRAASPPRPRPRRCILPDHRDPALAPRTDDSRARAPVVPRLTRPASSPPPRNR